MSPILILYLVDTKVGAQTDDLQLAKTLRDSGKPIILVANKADTPERVPIFMIFFDWAGRSDAISATGGLGIGELLDAIVGDFRSGKKLSRRMQSGWRWWGGRMWEIIVHK